jgi:hypothetical protein
MTAIVHLALATICYMHNGVNICHNALIGVKTPTGTFEVRHMLTKQPGYGGDILVYKETATNAFAIHRVWLGNPKQHRAERLASNDPNQRKHVTMGCINVTPEVYNELKDLTELEIRQN